MLMTYLQNLDVSKDNIKIDNIKNNILFREDKNIFIRC